DLRGQRLGHSRLARATEAAERDKVMPNGLEQSEREVEIGAGLLGEPVRGAAAFLSLRCVDMGSDRSANGHEEGKKDKAVVVVGCIQIAVRYEIGEAFEPAVPQVHEQEGEIIKHVHRGDGIVELDAVEKPRPAVEQTDV